MASIQDYYIMDRNPIQEQEYQKMLTEQGVPFTLENGKTSVQGAGVGGNNASRSAIDAAIGNLNATNATLANAEKVRQFNINANQPAIQQLQGALS